MTTDGLNGVVGRLRRTAATNVAAGRTDGALLGDFIDRCDGTAFDALVRRHGPMVLGVCRRVLGCRQDAEDAFQAVFLVLVRKASSIVPRDMVGNWLYGVAHQTAVRVRAQNLKRQHRERQMATMPEPETNVEPNWDDLGPVLDEELSRLPDRYRSVLVLCDVEGRTRKDAARHLKCPEGSVSSRLARARTMLSKRLARRGIALSGGAVSVLISEHAVAHIPHSLLDATLQCATSALAGTTAKSAGMLAVGHVTGQVPQKISLIAKGVLGAMALKKAIATGMLVTAFVLGSTTCGLVARHLQAGQDSISPGEEPKKSAPDKPAQAQPSAEELVRLLDSKEFPKREAAEKALVALGAKALPAVRAGTKSSLPEVAQRCERLLPLIRQVELASFAKAFNADTDRKAAFDHPVWKRYVGMVGDSKPSRELFAGIVKQKDWLSRLDAAEADPTKAGDIYRDSLREVGKHTLSNLSVGFLIPIWPCDQPEQVAYLLLLGSYKNTDPIGSLSYQDVPSRHLAEGEGRIKFGKGIGLALRGKRLAIDPKQGDRSIEVDDGGGNAIESGRVMLLLLAHWLEQRNLWSIVSEHVRDLSDHQKKQLLPFARRVVADKNAAPLCRAFWISIVRRFGDLSDAVRLGTLFEDKTAMDWPTVNRFGEGPGNVINQAEVREVAIGSAIYLRGRDPIDFGFTGLVNKPANKREDEIHSTLFTVKPVGTNDEKEKVLEKAIQWLAEQAKKEEPPAAKK